MAGYSPTSINRALALTPSDTIPCNPLMRGIYIGGAGNLTVQFSADNVNVVFPVVAAQMLWIGPNLVMATGTTATGLVAIL